MRFAGEAWEYSVIAESLQSGGGGAYHYLGAEYLFYGPALYPRLLAIVLGLTGGSYGAVIAVQILLFAATPPIVFAIARTFLAREYALAAGLLAAFHPGNLVYAAKLHPHALDVFLIATAFLLLCRYTIRPRMATGVACGVTLGLAALSRGTIGSFAIGWALWMLYQHRHRPWFGINRVSIVAMVSILTVSPVLINGYQKYRQFVPLRSDTGANFWIGNNPLASGTLVTAEPQPRVVQDLVPPFLAEQLEGLNELEQDSLLTQAALDWIKSEPRQFARLFLRKLGYFWWFSPSTGSTYPAPWLSLYMVYYAAILVAALAGATSLFLLPAGPHRRIATLFVLILSTYSVTQALFYVEGRHRWEIEPILLVLAVVGIARAWRRNPLAPVAPAGA